MNVKTYTLRMQMKYWRQLERVAKDTGVSVADVIRALIKHSLQEYHKGIEL